MAQAVNPQPLIADLIAL